MTKTLRPFGYRPGQLETLLPQPGICWWLSGCHRQASVDGLCDPHAELSARLTTAVHEARLALVAEAALIS